MSNFKEAAFKSFKHGLEILAVGAVFAFFYLQVSQDADVHKAVKELIVMAIGTAGTSIIPALLRKWNASSVPDYVNDR